MYGTRVLSDEENAKLGRRWWSTPAFARSCLRKASVCTCAPQAVALRFVLRGTVTVFVPARPGQFILFSFDLSDTPSFSGEPEGRNAARPLLHSPGAPANLPSLCAPPPTSLHLSPLFALFRVLFLAVLPANFVCDTGTAESPSGGGPRGGEAPSREAAGGTSPRPRGQHGRRRG